MRKLYEATAGQPQQKDGAPRHDRRVRIYRRAATQAIVRSGGRLVRQCKGQPIGRAEATDRSRLEAAAEGVIEARANRLSQEHGVDAREALSKRN